MTIGMFGDPLWPCVECGNDECAAGWLVCFDCLEDLDRAGTLDVSHHDPEWVGWRLRP